MIEKWLMDNGHLLLRWDKGTVVIESFYAKEFNRLGGDLERLISCFEDNCEINGAIEDYLK